MTTKKKKINKKETQKILSLVHDWEFFEDFSPKEVEDAIHLMSLRRVLKDEIIFQEDDAGDYLFLILDGRVEISLMSHSRNRIIAVLEAGGIVGEMSMLDHYHRSATAKAIEESEILILTANKLNQVLVENPPMGVKFLKQLGKIVALRLRSMVGNLAEIS